MRRFRALAVALAAAVLLINPGTAHAESGPFRGSGTASPGIPLVTAASNFISIQAKWITETETFDCTFDGSGTESLLLGSGAGILDCQGPTTSRRCSVDYIRVGGVLRWDGRCSGLVLTGLLAWVPTSVNPTTSFDVNGFVTCCTVI